jgi:signal transduction histidine kinase
MLTTREERPHRAPGRFVGSALCLNARSDRGRGSAFSSSRQEALTNTIRHARATQATVTLRYEPGYITVSVTDSGRRPDGASSARPEMYAAATGPPGSLLIGSGLGLAGIAERVASCGGNLSVGPTEADGFAVTARLPAR